jgi:hypothetical protein
VATGTVRIGEFGARARPTEGMPQEREAGTRPRALAQAPSAFDVGDEAGAAAGLVLGESADEELALGGDEAL